MGNKSELYLIAFVKFAEIWANNNIGSNIEINYEKLIGFVNSDRFVLMDGWDIDNLEDCYIDIEDKILNGFPIWDYFIIPEWTRNMLDLSFNIETQKERNKYACCSCEHLHEQYTSIGLYRKCTYEKETNNFRTRPKRRGPFELKEQCDDYKRKL